MEVYRTLDLVHRFPFKPQVEVVVDLKEILLGQQFPRRIEEVVLADQAVVLVVMLIMLVVVVQTLHHLLVNLVTLEAIQQQVVAPPQVEVVVLVVLDKIIDQAIMQDTVVLE
jgi:hypothetical protein